MPKWKPLVGDKVYRVESNGKQLFFEQYIVLKVTPKGYWFHYKMGANPTSPINYQASSWTKFGGRKVAPTKKEALKHYQGRKRCYIKHLKKRLEDAEIDMAMATEGVREPLERPVGGAWVQNCTVTSSSSTTVSTDGNCSTANISFTWPP